MKTYPKVSIVMASFLRADLLDIGLNFMVRNKPQFPIQVVVVNDGLKDDDTHKVCEKYSSALDIKYVFSGQRNTKGNIVKRCPAIANNIAIRQADGDIVILTCPEILHVNNCIERIVEPLLQDKKALSIPFFMYFDQSGEYTESVKQRKPVYDFSSLMLQDRHVQMPFFMGLWKQEIIDIGGYDEDFIGYASEDNDFVGRLLKNKCVYKRVYAQIIHLYHGGSFPMSGKGLINNPEWEYNHRLLEERKNKIVRNEGKDWGMVEGKKSDWKKTQNFNFMKMESNMNDIPKIMHLYWDKSNMSELQTQTVITFHKHNPDWEIRVYTPVQPYVLPKGRYVPDYTGEDHFQVVRDLAYVRVIDIDTTKYNIDPTLHNILQSDIFRYKILYKVGGLWSDFDVLWLKPISQLYNVKVKGNTDMNGMGTFVCRYESPTYFHNISVLMSVPKHPLYKMIIRECEKIQKENKNRDNLLHQTFGTDLFDKLFLTFRELLEKYPDVVKVPYKTFYPYSILNLGELYHECKVIKVMDENVIALHWFNGHKFSKAYVNGEKKQDCSMTRILDLIKSSIL